MLVDIYRTLQWLNERVTGLEMENQKLKEDLSKIQPIHIDSIVYKIQELQIKDLKGTLNIGITAQADEKTIDKFMQEFKEDNDATIEFDVPEEGNSQDDFSS
ncbi:MAG: spore germination protein GerPC [Bacilli bacterium]